MALLSGSEEMEKAISTWRTFQDVRGFEDFALLTPNFNIVSHKEESRKARATDRVRPTLSTCVDTRTIRGGRYYDPTRPRPRYRCFRLGAAWAFKKGTLGDRVT